MKTFQISFACIVLCLLTIPTADAQQANSDRPAKFYRPVVRQIEGWTVKIDPKLVDGEHRQLGEQALQALANHLQRVAWMVSESKVTELRKIKIWLEYDNRPLRNMQYHPNRRWLETNGHDPALEKHVHIGHANSLLDRKTWAKHPYVVLHELAHAYHDQVLGFDDAEIKSTFRAAKSAGSYEKVLDHRGRQVRHYAMNNHKEYFAESTEAYLGVNDFYPFVRAELKRHDPQMYALLQKIWGPVK